MLYRGQRCSKILLYLIYRSLRNLEQFLLCVRMLCEVRVSKHRIWQLNCLFNNYNVVIPRFILVYSIYMLKANSLVQYGTISTLRLEAMRGLKPRIIEFCKFIVYLIIIMFLYRSQSYSEMLLCLI